MLANWKDWAIGSSCRKLLPPAGPGESKGRGRRLRLPQCGWGDPPALWVDAGISGPQWGSTWAWDSHFWGPTRDGFSEEHWETDSSMWREAGDQNRRRLREWDPPWNEAGSRSKPAGWSLALLPPPASPGAERDREQQAKVGRGLPSPRQYTSRSRRVYLAPGDSRLIRRRRGSRPSVSSSERWALTPSSAQQRPAFKHSHFTLLLNTVPKMALLNS